MSKQHNGQSPKQETWLIAEEIKSLDVDLMSARCVVDRLRLRHELPTVARVADVQRVNRAQGNLLATLEYLQSLMKTTVPTSD